MSRRRHAVLRRLAAAPIGLIVALLWAGCSGDYPQTTFRPVTEFGDTLNDVFMNTFWWTMGIMVVVEVVLLYVIIRYRQRPDSETPKQIHGDLRLEILWTLIPAVIVALIAVPTVRTIFEIQEPPSDDAFVVEVIGHQWWWEFRYPELGIVTANEMHLPAGRDIVLMMRSADVIHSFWVPRVGGKRDVNPIPALGEGEQLSPNVNFLTFNIREPGAYSGVCAEFCGLSHAIMRTRIVAHEPEAFERWVQAWNTPIEPREGTLAAEGKQIFTSKACVACHAIQGTNARGVIGPNLTRMGERWSIGAGAIENTPANLAAWITAPEEIKEGVLMPGVHEEGGGLPPTGLTEEEVEAVAAYLWSLKGPEIEPTADVASEESPDVMGMR